MPWRTFDAPNALNNWLYGNYDNDRLIGNAGNDALIGGYGDDISYGGDGNDFGDGGYGNDSVYGDAGNDSLDGGVGNDFVYGGLGNDTTNGGDGNDVLDGGDGIDRMVGGKGFDRLTGGLGRDALYGGAQRDLFIFNALNESANSTQRDTIFDFQVGVDDIQLTAIDANLVAAGNQAFGFNGTVAGANKVWYTAGSNFVTVYADGTGDGVADFSLQVNNLTSLAATDFLL